MKRAPLGTTLLRLAAFVVAAATAACSSDLGPVDDECEPGETCSCDTAGSCHLSCAGAGCNFQCNGQGSCSFDCPGGGCDGFANGQGSVEMSCPGNGCTLTCSGQGSCQLSECTDNCAINCSGAGTCVNTCNAPSCG